jgi:hypothetical protein
MINVNQITSQLAKMPDPMLQKYAAMHKDDPYTVALALSESNRRKAMRVGANPMPGEQPKVVDQDIAEMSPPTQQMPQQIPQQMPQQMAQQLPENVGIGQLPAQNMQRMADGGIVGYAEGGSVPGYAEGVKVEDYVQKYAKEYNLDPARLAQIISVESGKAGAEAQNPKSSAHGLGQLVNSMWGKMGGGNRKDPETQVRNTAKLLRSNTDNFIKATGREPTPSESYTTWVLGDSTGRAVLKADPSTPVADIIKKASPKLADKIMSSNKEILVGKNAGDVVKWADNKMISVAAPAAAAAPVVAAAAPATSASAPVKPAAPAPGEDKRAWYDRYRDLAMSGDAQKAMLQGVQDVPSSLVGAPVDLSYYIANKLGRKPIEGEKPIMGSKYIQEKLGQLGVREPDSANPDLQNIREATSGIAGLYNPLSRTEAVETAAQAIARRARENAPKQLGGPTVTTATETAPKQLVGPTVTPAREAELVKAAEAEANAARVAREAELVKAAQAEANATRFTPYAEGPKAPQVGRVAAAQDVAGDLTARTRLADINPVGAAAVTPSAVEGITSLVSPDKKTPATTPDLPPEVKGGVEDLITSTAKDAGVKPSKFKDDMALMFFLNLMGGKSPNALTNASTAGISALKYGQELKKDESEQMYREALAKHYGVDPMIQRAQALQDPAIAKQFAKMKELEREPVTKEALLKAFMGSPEGMAASSDPAKFRTAFQNYIQSYESVLGPIGGMPPNVKVTRSGP